MFRHVDSKWILRAVYVLKIYQTFAVDSFPAIQRVCQWSMLTVRPWRAWQLHGWWLHEILIACKYLTAFSEMHCWSNWTRSILRPGIKWPVALGHTATIWCTFICSTHAVGVPSSVGRGWCTLTKDGLLNALLELADERRHLTMGRDVTFQASSKVGLQFADSQGQGCLASLFYLLRTERGVGVESQVLHTHLHSESEHISSQSLVFACFHCHSSPISYTFLCENLLHLALNTLQGSSISQHFDPCSTFLRWRA